MYFTYDIDGLTDNDVEKLTQANGVTSRMSHAYGERNRGRLISFDALLYENEDAVIASLPKGYAVKESTFKTSTGTIYKVPVTEETASPVTEEVKANRVMERLKSAGEKEALVLLSDLTTLGIIEKANTILPLMKHILAAARKNNYETINVLDMYKTIPKLRAMYWDNEDNSSCEGESLNLQVTKILYGRNLLLTVMKDRKAIFTHTSYYSNSNLLPMIYGSVFRIRIIFLYILQMKAIIVFIY